MDSNLNLNSSRMAIPADITLYAAVAAALRAHTYLSRRDDILVPPSFAERQEGFC
jgi:hypothetical protein